MRKVNVLLAVGGLLAGLAAATQLTLRAQVDPSSKADAPTAIESPLATAARPGAPASVQDALLRPFRFDFKKPISLTDLAGRLHDQLGAPVVLDLAALERRDVKAEDTVTLELDGVRLKTGLKLLLDQVGLTYRIVPEDNLLILTDREGAEDPMDRVVAELHELHRDIHELQDAMDELRELFSPSAGEGAKVRKPTIIEELPENAEPKLDEKPQTPTGKPAPRAGPNPNTPGSPLVRPRTRL
jgi:hypothetical protein